jgi:anti-anti-sigma regulatory factor
MARDLQTSTSQMSHMIRITTHNESLETRLILEGKLAGPCVRELHKCWRRARSADTKLLVDLTSVSFIDDLGKRLLSKMHQAGIKLVSHSLMSKCLIEEIKEHRAGH